MGNDNAVKLLAVQQTIARLTSGVPAETKPATKSFMREMSMKENKGTKKSRRAAVKKTLPPPPAPEPEIDNNTFTATTTPKFKEGVTDVLADIVYHKIAETDAYKRAFDENLCKSNEPAEIEKFYQDRCKKHLKEHAALMGDQKDREKEMDAVMEWAMKANDALRVDLEWLRNLQDETEVEDEE